MFLNKETNKTEETNEYMRYCYEHPDFPLHYLIIYKGDASCQNEYPHGNVTTGQMLSTNFIQTKQPQREVMKKGHGPPNKEYKRIVANAPPSINEFKVTARETSNKLQTFKPLKGKKLRLRRDDLYNLYEMENSQKFIRHFVSFPDVIVVMYLDEL